MRCRRQLNRDIEQGQIITAPGVGAAHIPSPGGGEDNDPLPGGGFLTRRRRDASKNLR